MTTIWFMLYNIRFFAVTTNNPVLLYCDSMNIYFSRSWTFTGVYYRLHTIFAIYCARAYWWYVDYRRNTQVIKYIRTQLYKGSFLHLSLLLATNLILLDLMCRSSNDVTIKLAKVKRMSIHLLLTSFEKFVINANESLTFCTTGSWSAK